MTIFASCRIERVTTAFCPRHEQNGERVEMLAGAGAGELLTV
jgi:hypothetical protein